MAWVKRVNTGLLGWGDAYGEIPWGGLAVTWSDISKNIASWIDIVKPTNNWTKR